MVVIVCIENITLVADRGCCGEQRTVVCTVPAAQNARIIVDGSVMDILPDDENEIIKTNNGFEIHIVELVPHPTLAFFFNFIIEVSYTVQTTQVTISCGDFEDSITKDIMVDGKSQFSGK